VRIHVRAVAAVAIVPLLLGVAACGGEEKATGTLPSSAPTTAVEKTITAAPPKVAQPPVARLTKATFVPAMNTALASQKTWRTTAKMTAGGETVMTITGFQQSEPMAMSMEMSGVAFNGGKAKVIVVNDTAYVSIPGATPAGKYLKLDANDPEVGSLADSGDPTKTFKAFEKSLRNAKFVKTETIDGRKLDRYDLTVDTASALRAQGKTVPKGTPKTLTYSVWMDSAKLIRRLSFDLAGVAMVMNMTDYNKPVTIKAPPASKTITR